jgi:hypothetical protein
MKEDVIDFLLSAFIVVGILLFAASVLSLLAYIAR